MSDKVLSGIYEMKTTLPLFFSKSMLAVSLVCGAVWLAVQPFRLCAMNPEGFDSLQMYRDSIRWSSNNVAKSEWLEKAARYSLRTGDTASLLSFKIEQAYLRFSSGNYVEAFDSLILIEKKISDHVRVPSLLATDAVYKPFAVDSKDDSLWVGMHVTAGIFREALDEATSRAFGHLSLYIRSNLVYVLVEQGNLEEAEMLAQENLVSAIEIDNLEMQENALVYLSHIAEAHQNFYEGLQYKDSAYRVGRRLIEQNNKLRQGIICGGWNSTGNSKRWNVPSGRWPC